LSPTRGSRLRGAQGCVGSHLSAGLDSGAVATSAARLLAPDGGRVVAFTAVPRAGYDGPVPHGRLGDEGPLAAEVAALYPNIEHVRVPTDYATMLDAAERYFQLADRAPLSLPAHAWGFALNDASPRARSRWPTSTRRTGAPTTCRRPPGA